jgi:hypothetical protein
VQEKALVGNTIFFAQPTADVPSMQLPPPPDALVDSLNVIFTRSLHDLSKAEWAIVNRDEYMRIVRERKAQCPVFADVTLCEAEADSRLPAHGVPDHVRACALEVDGSEQAIVRLRVPLPELLSWATKRKPATSQSMLQKATRTVMLLSSLLLLRMPSVTSLSFPSPWIPCTP